MVEFGKYLTHVQAAFGGRPVVIAFNAVGDGDGELGARAVLRVDLFRQIEAHVGVVFVTQAPDRTTD